ncbi:hypothetical protein BD410DRAFT_893942 [Rickenella mellea]|uniref:Prolyl 4-hydroxylase alpha subunit Fe(2+) 2OG dioxygenase domain-containing protein n=1 Tax=Rickenella mellea TaxID=50990 RepID=A0A4Y7QLG7_9AGAM|nr:hypothetical protein BD410DRAFT_893942 [Rickenella mellea]
MSHCFTPKMTSAINVFLKPLANAVNECGKNAPWCSGTWAVPLEELKVYFDIGTDTRSIQCANATEAQLDELTKACQPATFGANQADVLDETYRKAGKMDLEHFAINFSPERVGLALEVKSRLLGLDADERSIKLEPYKLKSTVSAIVFFSDWICRLNRAPGKGSFFKAHKDTPRGEKMFGSLVVVLPTAHEGGGLLLRHDQKEMVFDSGKAFDSKPLGTIAFVAFYSDVEHEVQQVTPGHWVTITYNLYFAGEKEALLSAPAALTPAADQFFAVLKNILANPEFFPKGGLLGFGLKHQYPLSSDRRGNFDLKNLLTCLKGEDTAILRACTAQGLTASLKIIYEANDGWLVMCDKPAVGLNYQVEDLVDDLISEFDGVCIWVPRRDVPCYLEQVAETWRKTVKWMTPMKSMTSHIGHFVAYGNEAELGYLYGQVSLIVEVGIPGQRQDPSTIVPFNLKRDWARAYNPTDIPDGSDTSDDEAGSDKMEDDD